MRSDSVASLDNGDVEASKLSLDRDEGVAPRADEGRLTTSGLWRKVNSQLSVEGHGVAPITEEERTDARFLQCFTLWCVLKLPNPAVGLRRDFGICCSSFQRAL